MKKPYLRFSLIILPIIVVIGYYSFFHETKVTDENSHITQLIEKLPEYIELNKYNEGYIHIDFPKDTSRNFVNANILTFRLNGDPAKLIYRVQYDKQLDKITSIEKEQ
jgi:hypothetical protein